MYISGDFLLNNIKHYLESYTLFITKMRKIEVPKAIFHNLIQNINERKENKIKLYSFRFMVFVSALLNELL